MLYGWDSINGDNVKGDCLIRMGRGGNRRTGNKRTSPNSSSHAESSWRLEKLTEGAVTIGMGRLFPYFYDSC